MPIAYLTEHDTKSFRVKIENIELVKVQNFEKIYDNEKNTLCVKPLEKYLGKGDVTNMLIKLGSLHKSVYSGNTMLLETREENKNRYVYVGAGIINSFITTSHFLQYISNIGDNINPYSIAIGEENIYFFSKL